MKVLSIQTGGRTDFINITPLVQAAAREVGFQDGSLTVFIPHTTAGITKNEVAAPNQ